MEIDYQKYLRSQTATRKGIKEQYFPSLAVKEKLKDLDIFFVKTIEAKLRKKLQISSGYRCPRLNKAIGGARGSQHEDGEAIDFTIEGFTTEEIVRLIIHYKIEVDQCIEEFGEWVHVSFVLGKNRKQFLRAKKVKNKTVYEQFK